MGIDRHELEHRNWRPSAARINDELDCKLAEQFDTSLVPVDDDGAPLALRPKQVKHEKIA